MAGDIENTRFLANWRGCNFVILDYKAPGWPPIGDPRPPPVKGLDFFFPHTRYEGAGVARYKILWYNAPGKPIDGMGEG